MEVNLNESYEVISITNPTLYPKMLDGFKNSNQMKVLSDISYLIIYI